MCRRLLLSACLRCRYDADAQLLERLRTVHTVEQMRQLLKQLHTEGWLAANAAALQARLPQEPQEVEAEEEEGEDAEGQQAEQQGQQQESATASDSDSEDVGPALPWPGVSYSQHDGRWAAAVSTPAGSAAPIFHHSQPAPAAVAADLAAFWQQRISLQPGIASAQEPLLQDRWAVRLLPLVRQALGSKPERAAPCFPSAGMRQTRCSPIAWHA